MKKGLVEIVFILDRSGSMRGLETDTIGGYNALIEKQRKEEGEAILSTILFDDQVKVLYDRVELSQAPQMTEEEYYVRGCTALLDALGGAISHTKKAQKAMKKKQRPEKTLFVITTDGLENASHRYSIEKVRKMIGKREKKGWEFLFLGANMDAVSVAASYGIDANHTTTFLSDGEGTRLNYEVLGDAISEVRANASEELALSPGWKVPIERDVQARTPRGWKRFFGK